MENIIENVRIMPGQYINADAHRNVIQYVLQHRNESPIGGSAVFPVSIESADEQFQIIREKYKQTDGRKVLHICLTYPDKSSASKEKILSEAKKVSELIGTQFQNVYGLHENTDNLHVHFAINSVNYQTGKKISTEQIGQLISINSF